MPGSLISWNGVLALSLNKFVLVHLLEKVGLLELKLAARPLTKRTLSPGKHPRLKQQRMYCRTQGVLRWTRRIYYHYLQDTLHSQPQHQFYGPRMTTS